MWYGQTSLTDTNDGLTYNLLYYNWFTAAITELWVEHWRIGTVEVPIMHGNNVSIPRAKHGVWPEIMWSMVS